MGRLKNEKKAQIIALKKANLSWNTISRKLQVPRPTVRSIWSKFIVNKSYANVKSTGRRKKFTVRDERQLIRCAVANKKNRGRNFSSHLIAAVVKTKCH